MGTLGRPKKEFRDFRAEKIRGVEAAALLNIPERTFYYLVEVGVIPKSEDGTFVLGAVLDAYIRKQTDTNSLTAAKIRLTTAQAEKEELELEKRRGELVSAEAVKKVWAQDALNCKAKLLAIPIKIAPELVGLSPTAIQAKLKAVIYEALRELAGYAAERIAAAEE